MGAQKSVVKSKLQTYTHQILSDGSLATRKEAERRKREAEIIQQKFEEYQQKKIEEEQKCEIFNFFANSTLKKKSQISKKSKKSSKSPKKKIKSSKNSKKSKSNSKKSKKTKTKKKSPKSNKKSNKSSTNTKNSQQTKIDTPQEKENQNNINTLQQKNNIQKLLDKERDLHLITESNDEDDYYIQSIEQFDDSILSADQDEIRNFLCAYEERQKYDITNNEINDILRDINIGDLDIDEEIESLFQRKSQTNLKLKPSLKQFQLKQDDDYKNQHKCNINSFQKF